MAAVITNLDGLVFAKGFLYLTRDGGVADAVSYPALQDISVTHEFGYVEIAGPEALSPLGVGVTGETLSGSCSNGVFTAEELFALNGGQMTVSGSNTIVTKRTDEEPKKFDMKLKTPSDGSDLTLTVYRCLASSIRLVSGSMNRQFMPFSFDWRAYGQATSDGSVLYSMQYSGNQTSSS